MDKRSFICGRDYSIDPRNRPAPTDKKVLETLYDDQEENFSSTESIASASSKDTASVHLRVRPSGCAGHFAIENNIFKILNGDRSVEKQYTFSSVLSDKAMQREVYTTSVESAIDNDENLTLMMYGTSGSGKTYTLMGDADQPGIIPRAIEHIFTRYAGSISSMPKFKPVKGDYSVLSDDEIDSELIRRQDYFKSNDSIFSGDKEKIQSEHNFVKLKPVRSSVFIWISFFEIYNETVKDLLEIVPAKLTNQRNHLKMMTNSGKTYVNGLTTVFTMSSDEATQLLTTGLNYRLNASTNVNHTSSRSHCLFLIDIIKCEATTVFYNRYRFCDLAGSERVKKSETTGTRLKETQNINTSLLVLGRCLDIAFTNQSSKKRELVPVRDSKLTTFLQAPLKGKEKLTMIVNIWPITDFYDENLNVLSYAAMARNIVYKLPAPVQRHSVSRRYSFFLGPQPKEDSNVSIILDENFRLKQINEEVGDENDRLYTALDELQERNDELKKEKELIERETRKDLVERFQKEMIRKEEAFEERLQLKVNFIKKCHEEDMEELKQKLKRRDDEINRLYDIIDKLEGNSGDDEGENVPDSAINGHNDSDTIIID